MIRKMDYETSLDQVGHQTDFTPGVMKAVIVRFNVSSAFPGI